MKPSSQSHSSRSDPPSELVVNLSHSRSEVICSFERVSKKSGQDEEWIVTRDKVVIIYELASPTYMAEMRDAHGVASTCLRSWQNPNSVLIHSGVSKLKSRCASVVCKICRVCVPSTRRCWYCMTDDSQLDKDLTAGCVQAISYHEKHLYAACLLTNSVVHVLS